MPPKRAAVMHESEDDDMDMQMMMGDAMGAGFAKFLNPNFSAEFLATLPEKVRQRAEVLMHYEEQFQQEERALLRKISELTAAHEAEHYAPLHQRRRELVTGAGAAPTDAEVAKGMPEEHVGVVGVEGGDAAAGGGPIEGFWLRVLQHHVGIASRIEEHDEEVLRHLRDITSATLNEDGADDVVAVTFHFAPDNGFFEEETVTLTARKDPETGAESLTRTPLTWKPGKDVTVEVVEKKQRSKKTGQTRVVHHEQPRQSFFSMFKERAANAGEEDEEEEEDDDEDEQINFILRILHHAVIPGAVHHYTGEADDGASDVEEDEEDEDEEEEEEEEIRPPIGRRRH